jgi:hypothetical protein
MGNFDFVRIIQDDLHSVLASGNIGNPVAEILTISLRPGVDVDQKRFNSLIRGALSTGTMIAEEKHQEHRADIFDRATVSGVVIA